MAPAPSLEGLSMTFSLSDTPPLCSITSPFSSPPLRNPNDRGLPLLRRRNLYSHPHQQLDPRTAPNPPQPHANIKTGASPHKAPALPIWRHTQWHHNDNPKPTAATAARADPRPR